MRIETETAPPTDPDSDPFALRRTITEKMLGPVVWKTESRGVCFCPNSEQHTSGNADRPDATVFLDSESPTIYCFHHHCRAAKPSEPDGPIDEANHALRRAIRAAERTA